MKDSILVFNCSEVADGIVIECVTQTESLGRREVAFSSEHSQNLLSVVQQVCSQSKTALSELLGIALIYGGERFTVSRLGAVTANALAWSRHIPICGFERVPSSADLFKGVQAAMVGTPVQPRYSKEPNITL